MNPRGKNKRWKAIIFWIARIFQVNVHRFVMCDYCNNIKFYEGDAPLPDPITLGTIGLTEHHCGYKGAPSPRFTFKCPYCNGEQHEPKG